MNNIDQIIEQVVSNPDYIISLNCHEIEEALELVEHIFEKEQALIELDGDVVFAGDLHGDFETTKSIIRHFFDVDHLVFLGDYIDREPVQWGSIYTLTYLLLLKCRFPEKLILLKGNHESHFVIPCFPYEFEHEIVEKFASVELHSKFTEVFAKMPLMVLLKNVFASHAGILKGADLTWLRTREKDDANIIRPLTWDDPDISGIVHGDTFTETDLIQFLTAINAKAFIRGHNYNTLGYSIYGDRCLTIFSSRLYKEEGNKGIIVVRTNGHISKISDLALWDFSTDSWMRYVPKKR